MGYQELVLSDPGLLWYWKFDGSGLVDSKNSIAISGANATSSFVGNIFAAVGNGSINVNSSTGTPGLYADVNGSAAFGQTDFSVEFFTKKSNTSSKPFELLVDARTTGTSGWFMGFNSSQIQVQMGPSYAVVYSTFSVNTEINHIVFTRSYNKSPILYLNGVSVASGPIETNNLNNSSYLSIGNRAFGANNAVNYNGAIDEVSIYNYAMSGTIVGQHYSTARYYIDAHNKPWLGQNVNLRR